MNLKQYLLDKIVQAVLPVLVDRATDAVEKALETKAQAKVLELTNQEAIPAQEVADAMGLKWPAINTKE